jgi:DNA-binding CsgD family transcriptional regulator
MSSAPINGDELAEIRAELAEIDRELRARGRPSRAREHAEALALLKRRFEQRFAGLGRAHAAAASLQRLTSPGELLAQAPRALCDGTAFDRAIVSAIADGALQGRAAYFAADPEAGEDVLARLGFEPIRLEHRLVESDALRRRRATLVSNAAVNPRVDPRIAAALDVGSYIAAPLISGGSVIGMLHAARAEARTLDVLDRDVLWEFATVLSQIHESAELRRRLRRERDELRRFLEWLNARSVSLADAPITFAAYLNTEPVPAVLAPAITATTTASAARDDRLVFAGLLPRRELDVLRLLADGCTNRTIADTLVLSQTTVKFHTGNILRKLRVANRAEAVARYLTMLGPRA